MFVAGFLGASSMNFVEGRLGDATEDGVSFEAGPLRVNLSHDVFVARPPLRAAAVLGVRPEHISLQPADAKVDAQVTLVELMGSHFVVWLDMQGQRLAASVSPNDEPAVGETVGLAIDFARACVFHPQSELRI